MFSHVMVGTNDVERSRRFYDALFGALGAKPGRVDDKGRAAWAHKGALFMISRPIDQAPACHANGGTIGFSCDGAEQVEAWHKAGLAAGGIAIEDPPGVRQGSFGPLYLAYLRDPDGNKLCALYRMPT